MQGKLLIIMTSFPCFVWWQIRFQISSLKVTACLLPRALTKIPLQSTWQKKKKIFIEKDSFKWRASSEPAKADALTCVCVPPQDPASICIYLS